MIEPVRLGSYLLFVVLVSRWSSPLRVLALVGIVAVGCSQDGESDREGRVVFSDSGALITADANGANVVQISDHSLGNSFPEWSPDGTQIAFDSDRDGDLELFVMDADGSNMTQITNNSANDASPSWSPDGTQIAFHSDRDGDLELFVMDADGSNMTQITNNSANDGFPEWSPDGTQIVFQSDRIGDGQFFVATLDDQRQQPFADHKVDGETISWTSE